MLEQIRDHAIKELSTLFTEMLDGADDALFDQADKARSNKDQALYFDSMRELRIKRKGMEKVFSQELLSNFQKLQITNKSLEESSLDEFPMDNFSLVQEDELEENLAIDSMVAKAENKNEQAIIQIVTRLDTLLANVRVDTTNNPVSPRFICESFREASHSLELDIKAKLIVYKLFDRLVASRFPHVYAEINEYLVKHGVLPDLPGPGAAFKKKQAARRKAAQQNRRESDSENNYDEDYSSGAGAGADIGTEVLSALRNLLAVQRGGATIGGVPVVAGAVSAQGVVASTPTQDGVLMAPVVDNRQLVQALSTVQADIQQQPVAAGGGYLPVADLRGQIGTVLPVTGPVSSTNIGQANDDVIDIISMLFDFILDDKNLPDEFKALIGRLQIPLLKVALLDETFFSKGNHPARKLLNEMARAGIGWTQETDGSGVGLRDKVEEIVTTILNEFVDDTSIFAEALEDFHGFTNEHQKRAELVEKRIREAEEGKAKSETAKAKAEDALKKIVGHHKLPEAVGRLVFEAWQSVMLLIYLREGDTSEAWKKHLLTAEELMLSLIPPKTIEARKRLTGILPGLVKSIKGGLDAVAYGEFESARLFQELEQIHLKVLKGQSVLIDENTTSETDEQSETRYIDEESSQDLEQELAGIDPNAEIDNSKTGDFADDLDFEGFEDEHEINLADKKKIKQMDLAQITGNSTVDLDALGGIEEIDMSVNAPSNYSEIKGTLPEDDQFQALVNTLQVGSWFELTNQDKKVRCKLAAIIPTVGKYIFVSRTGIKVADYTKSGLALALRRQDIVQLNDGALFDRALESIVSNLRSLKKTQDEGL